MKKLIILLFFFSAVAGSAQQAFPTQMEGEYRCLQITSPSNLGPYESTIYLYLKRDTADIYKFLVSSDSTFQNAQKLPMDSFKTNYFIKIESYSTPHGSGWRKSTLGYFYPIDSIFSASPQTDSLFLGSYFTSWPPYRSRSSEYYCKKPISTSSYESKLEVIRLYPNPVKDELVLKGISKKITFRVHTMQGQLLKSGFVSSQQGIQVNELPPGIYLLQLGEGKEQVWRKVVKE